MQQAYASLILLLLFFTACGENESVSNEQQNPPLHPTPPIGMAYIPGGTYTRGQQQPAGNGDPYEEELPAHKVSLNSFFIDVTEVTNRQFEKFTKETGYKTQAERGWSAKDFPLAPPDSLKPGAIIFRQNTTQQNPNESVWGRFSFVAGASWRKPYGVQSRYQDYLDHPVVCVTYEDAQAYAKWAGKRLPTEAEWERASRGGIEGKRFTWGDKTTPHGKWMANVFQGHFPNENTALDGFKNTAPARSFPANAYGLYDMSGNVWEICSDYYDPGHYQNIASPAINPTGAKTPRDMEQVQYWMRHGVHAKTSTPIHPFAALRVARGGSYLCHASYCLRYRNAARHYAESLAPSNHIGFRCVKDVDQE